MLGFIIMSLCGLRDLLPEKFIPSHLCAVRSGVCICIYELSELLSKEGKHLLLLCLERMLSLHVGVRCDMEALFRFIRRVISQPLFRYAHKEIYFYKW